MLLYSYIAIQRNVLCCVMFVWTSAFLLINIRSDDTQSFEWLITIRIQTLRRIWELLKIYTSDFVSVLSTNSSKHQQWKVVCLWHWHFEQLQACRCNKFNVYVDKTSLREFCKKDIRYSSVNYDMRDKQHKYWWIMCIS